MSITNVFAIMVSMRIIKMVQLNGLYARFMKYPVLWWFTRLFSGKMALDQTCGPWILVMPPIFTLLCPIPRKFHPLISSLELNTPVTSLNILTCGVVISMYCIIRFNIVVNSWNGSYDFVGFSPPHSSDVPLIINPYTGHIYPQFHVVFDVFFSTVYISFSWGRTSFFLKWILSRKLSLLSAS